MIRAPEGYTKPVLHPGKDYTHHLGGIEAHLQTREFGACGDYENKVRVATDHLRRHVEYMVDARFQYVRSFCGLASVPLTPTMPTGLRRSLTELMYLHTFNPGAALAPAVSDFRGSLIAAHHSDTLGCSELSRLIRPLVP